MFTFQTQYSNARTVVAIGIGLGTAFWTSFSERTWYTNWDSFLGLSALGFDMSQISINFWILFLKITCKRGMDSRRPVIGLFTTELSSATFSQKRSIKMKLINQITSKMSHWIPVTVNARKLEWNLVIHGMTLKRKKKIRRFWWNEITISDICAGAVSFFMIFCTRDISTKFLTKLLTTWDFLDGSWTLQSHSKGFYDTDSCSKNER